MQLRDFLSPDLGSGPFYGDERWGHDDDLQVIVDPVNCMVVAVIPRLPPPSKPQRPSSPVKGAGRRPRRGFLREVVSGWLERFCPVVLADHDGWGHS
jgi:hypothetical protein